VLQGTGIPLVFAHAFIEDVDLIESMREPGKDITGVRYPGSDLAIKRFEILLDMVPDAKRVWVPYLQGYPSVPSQLEVVRSMAAASGVTLIEAPATSAAELQDDLARRVRGDDPGIDAMLFLAEPMCVNPEAVTVIGAFAAEHNLPVGGSSSPLPQLVFSLLPQNVAVGYQAATVADKVLKGTPAGAIPVVSPESYLKIYYTQAKALGLDAPEGLLSRADEIIR
jgi:putative ABC transport system substrate-binding protein